MYAELEIFQDDEGVVINGVRFCPSVFEFFSRAAHSGTVFRFLSPQDGRVTLEILALPEPDRTAN